MDKLKIAHHFKTVLPAEDFLLTGSFALSKLGLKVKSKDLDLMLVKPKESTLQVLKDLEKENPPKNLINYPVSLKNRQLFRFMYEGTEVDVFIYHYSVPSDVQTKCGLKLASIQHIIKAKKDLNRPKDILQLMSLSKSIINDTEVNEYLNRFR
jgi:hypothetical protein